ncbi:MAG: hypothetical protein F6J98_05235 [Moorea sp. SIO4G2]|nr:hypothetical protein [Moorena sp. SIO4G2]
MYSTTRIFPDSLGALSNGRVNRPWVAPLPTPDSRFPIPDSRFPIPDSRFAHSKFAHSKFPIPSSLFS